MSAFLFRSPVYSSLFHAFLSPPHAHCFILAIFVDDVDNEIGDDGARYLSDGLRENSTLLYLVLPREFLFFISLYFLGSLLRFNLLLLLEGGVFIFIFWVICVIGMIELDNLIGVEGAAYLYTMLMENSTLLHLHAFGEHSSFSLMEFVL